MSVDQVRDRLLPETLNLITICHARDSMVLWLVLVTFPAANALLIN